MVIKVLILTAIVAAVHAGAPVAYEASSVVGKIATYSAAPDVSYSYTNFGPLQQAAAPTYAKVATPVSAPSVTTYNAPTYTTTYSGPSFQTNNPTYATYSAPTITKYATPIAQAYATPAVHYNAAPVVAKVAAPVVAKTIVAEPAAPAQYDFEYSVQDTITGDSKSQYESRRGDVVQGSYSLIDADGTKRIVEYTADAVNGFNAVVHKEQPTVAVKTAAPVVASAPVVAKFAQPVAFTTPTVSKVAAPVSYSAPSFSSSTVYHN